MADQMANAQRSARLALTPDELRLLLLVLRVMDSALAAELNQPAGTEGILLTWVNLAKLSGYLTVGQSSPTIRRGDCFTRILKKIDALLLPLTGDEASPILDNLQRPEARVERALSLVHWASYYRYFAKQWRADAKKLQELGLVQAERATLADLPSVPDRVRGRLRSRNSQVTVADAAEVCTAIAQTLLAEPEAGVQDLVAFATELLESMRETVLQAAKVAERRLRGKPTQIFELTITLRDIQPAIWRRLRVADCTLEELHDLLQVVMGWENYHLFCFEIGDRRYGVIDPEEDWDDELRDAASTLLSRALGRSGARCEFTYRYDFGDDWEHTIRVDRRRAVGPGDDLTPVCLEGARACPPEDVGGCHGYAEYLEALADPNHERFQEFRDWRGAYDAEAFPLAAVNRTLRRMR